MGTLLLCHPFTPTLPHLEIHRSILWANASAGAETLNFGKGSSDDERLNKTVVGSTNK